MTGKQLVPWFAFLSFVAAAVVAACILFQGRSHKKMLPQLTKQTSHRPLSSHCEGLHPPCNSDQTGSEGRRAHLEITYSYQSGSCIEAGYDNPTEAPTSAPTSAPTPIPSTNPEIYDVEESFGKLNDQGTPLKVAVHDLKKKGNYNSYDSKTSSIHYQGIQRIRQGGFVIYRKNQYHQWGR